MPPTLSGTMMLEPVLRRGNSLSVVEVKNHPLNNQNSSFSIFNGGKKVSHVADDLELVSFGLQTKYTSLKDVLSSLPGAGNQSPDGAGGGGYEICIRNHLVKQAAWAYLQPKAVTPGSSGRHFIQRIWIRFFNEHLKRPVNSCFEFINRHIVSRIKRAFNQLIGLIDLGLKKQGR